MERERERERSTSLTTLNSAHTNKRKKKEGYRSERRVPKLIKPKYGQKKSAETEQEPRNWQRQQPARLPSHFETLDGGNAIQYELVYTYVGTKAAAAADRQTRKLQISPEG